MCVWGGGGGGINWPEVIVSKFISISNRFLFNPVQSFTNTNGSNVQDIRATSGWLVINSLISPFYTKEFSSLQVSAAAASLRQ